MPMLAMLPLPAGVFPSPLTLPTLTVTTAPRRVRAVHNLRLGIDHLAVRLRRVIDGRRQILGCRDVANWLRCDIHRGRMRVVAIRHNDSGHVDANGPLDWSSTETIWWSS